MTELTQEQIDEFIERGYIVLHECFSRESAQYWTDKGFQRLGYDKDDPGTWAKPRIHMPTMNVIPTREFAPKMWGGICDLVGGEDRVQPTETLGDGFIVNLAEGADRPWEPASASSPGWHKDGDFFRHFLDSPEQGLLIFVLWSDVEHKGGATFIAPDSVPVVARFLAERPEGVLPREWDTRALIGQCHDFAEMTGKVGDVVLLHPFMLHAVSQNYLRKPRIITNPPIHLKAPMCFNRSNPADYSPVERATLRALGVDKLDFVPTAPRERVHPERERIQAAMLEEEKKRLAGIA